MTPLSGSTMVTASSDAAIHTRKIIHAAHEFEAVLLNTMLGPLEQTFSSLPGKNPDSESDNYHYLGMQALSSTLANSKAFGISDLLIRKLSSPELAASATK